MRLMAVTGRVYGEAGAPRTSSPGPASGYHPAHVAEGFANPRQRPRGRLPGVKASWRAWTRPERLLRLGLAVVAAVIVARAWAVDLVGYPIAVDLEIPLRATERWLNGGEPYLASAFTGSGGATQPFLYPPYVLPFLSPLALLPRTAVAATWIMLLLVVAIATLRRLGVPWRWVPAVLAWPPFAEPLIGGNVQVLLFWSFVALYWQSSGGVAGDRHLEVPRERDLALGLKAGAIAFLKVGQLQPWLHVARWRPKGAAYALLAAVGLVLVTLPLVGIDAWQGWAAQLIRATDRGWPLGGFALPRFLPGVGLVICVIASLSVLAVGPKAAGRSVGLLTVIGAPSLYIFGLLFALPAMLWVRREIALVAAALVATYSYEGAWAGIALVAVAHVASSWIPYWREPTGDAAAVGGEIHEALAAPPGTS